MVRFSKAYRKRIADRNRLRGKRSQEVQREGRMSREIDADTLRQRALFDRRGTEYATVMMGGQRFTLLWSTAGRCDQVDVFCDGQRLDTVRPSLVLGWLAQHVGR